MTMSRFLGQFRTPASRMGPFGEYTCSVSEDWTSVGPFVRTAPLPSI